MVLTHPRGADRPFDPTAPSAPSWCFPHLDAPPWCAHLDPPPAGRGQVPPGVGSDRNVWVRSWTADKNDGRGLLEDNNRGLWGYSALAGASWPLPRLPRVGMMAMIKAGVIGGGIPRGTGLTRG